MSTEHPLDFATSLAVITGYKEGVKASTEDSPYPPGSPEDVAYSHGWNWGYQEYLEVQALELSNKG